MDESSVQTLTAAEKLKVGLYLMCFAHSFSLSSNSPLFGISFSCELSLLFLSLFLLLSPFFLSLFSHSLSTRTHAVASHVC